MTVESDYESVEHVSKLVSSSPLSESGDNTESTLTSSPHLSPDAQDQSVFRYSPQLPPRLPSNSSSVKHTVPLPRPDSVDHPEVNGGKMFVPAFYK